MLVAQPAAHRTAAVIPNATPGGKTPGVLPYVVGKADRERAGESDAKRLDEPLRGRRPAARGRRRSLTRSDR